MSKPVRKDAFRQHIQSAPHEATGADYIVYALNRSPECSDKDEIYALYLTYALIENGYGLPMVFNLLAHLDWRELRSALENLEAHQALGFSTPVHFKESRDYKTCLWISHKYESFIKRWLKRRPQGGSQSFNRLAIKGAGNPEVRYKTVKDLVEKLHKEAFRRWNTGQPKREKSISLNMLSDICNNLIVRESSIPAGLLASIRDIPASVSPSNLSFHNTDWYESDYSGLSEATLDIARIASAAKAKSNKRVQDDSLDSDIENEIEEALDNIDLKQWVIAQKANLKEKHDALSKDFGTRKIKLGNRHARLTVALKNWMKEELLGFNNIPRLGLLWVTEAALGSTLNPKSAASYLSTVVTNLALHHTKAPNLEDWDQEDIDSLFIYIRNDRSLREGTRTQKARRLRAFFVYCKKRGFFEELKIPTVKNDYIEIDYRNHILRPSEIEYIIKTLAEFDLVVFDQIVLFLILGYYGGLRSGEVKRIRLKHIDIPTLGNSEHTGGHPEVWVNVSFLKTDPSRRTIPLHVLAPPEIVDIFVRLAQKREAQFTRHKKKGKLHLIGGYQVESLRSREIAAQNAIQVLKNEFGEHMDLHTLRHNFGTLLLLRVSATYIPNIEDPFSSVCQTPERMAWLSKLSQYLRVDAPFNDNTAYFTEITKLMGHSDFSVALSTYIHSISEVMRVLTLNRASDDLSKGRPTLSRPPH